MKLVALLSGGKDSFYAMSKAMSLGHDIVAVASLYSWEEKDSHMFQSAATGFVPYIAKAMNLPIIAHQLKA
jgi:diphthine-ammonia ligase